MRNARNGHFQLGSSSLTLASGFSTVDENFAEWLPCAAVTFPPAASTASPGRAVTVGHCRSRASREHQASHLPPRKRGSGPKGAWLRPQSTAGPLASPSSPAGLPSCPAEKRSSAQLGSGWVGFLSSPSLACGLAFKSVNRHQAGGVALLMYRCIETKDVTRRN